MFQELTLPLIMMLFGFALMLVELVIGIEAGFDLVLLGVSFILGGGVGYFFNSWQTSLILSLLLASSYVVFGRKIIKSKLMFTAHHSNVDQLIDKKGIVEKKIAPHVAGQVRIGSEHWRAEADETIEVNAHVKVESIEGVTLKVIKL